MPFVNGIWVDDPEEEIPSESEPTPEPEVPVKNVEKSILLSIKKMLGIAEDHHAFDVDILLDINATFLTLNQLGIGPKLQYSITDDTDTWKDFLGDQKDYIAAVQTYVYMRVRLMFDPPTNSFLVDSMQKQIQEFEWRFTIQPTSEKEVEYVESFKNKIPPYGKEVDKDDSNSSEEENQNESVEPTTFAATNISATASKLYANKRKKKNLSLYDIFG